MVGVEFIMLSIQVEDGLTHEVSKLVSSLALLQQSFSEMDVFFKFIETGSMSVSNQRH